MTPDKKIFLKIKSSFTPPLKKQNDQEKFVDCGKDYLLRTAFKRFEVE